LLGFCRTKLRGARALIFLIGFFWEILFYDLFCDLIDFDLFQLSTLEAKIVIYMIFARSVLLRYVSSKNQKKRNLQPKIA